MNLAPYHAKFLAYELTRRCPPDSDDRPAGALVDAQVDLNPHQIEAALFAFRSPLSRGVLLADEVGLGGFRRGLYPTQKFASDTERRFAVILDRDAQRWFKPASGQFQIYYRLVGEQPRYVPDFVAETKDELLLLETKARGQMESREVAAKKRAAEEWCRHAAAHAATYGGKPWRYVLVPHDVVTDNMTLEFLARA